VCVFRGLARIIVLTLSVRLTRQVTVQSSSIDETCVSALAADSADNGRMYIYL